MKVLSFSKELLQYKFDYMSFYFFNFKDEKRLLNLTPKRFHGKAQKLLEEFNQRGI
jgi:hypothetical protein